MTDDWVYTSMELETIYIDVDGDDKGLGAGGVGTEEGDNDVAAVIGAETAGS